MATVETVEVTCVVSDTGEVNCVAFIYEPSCIECLSSNPNNIYCVPTNYRN